MTKKSVCSLLALSLVLVMVMTLFTGCVKKIDTIELEEDEITLAVGEKYEVEYEILPKEAEGELSWESDDEDVAKVNSSGRITAKGAGECTITVTADSGAEAEIEVTVLTPVESIETDVSSLSMSPEETYQLSYTLTPSDAEAELTWKSSDESVATVKNGLVTAVSDGVCTLSVSAPNGVSAVVEVTVASMPYEELLLVGSWELDMAIVDDEYYTDTVGSMYLYEDNTGEIWIGDDVEYATWYFYSEDEDCYFYDLTFTDGSSCLMFLYHSGEYAGDVVVYMDDSNMLFFE